MTRLSSVSKQAFFAFSDISLFERVVFVYFCAQALLTFYQISNRRRIGRGWKFRERPEIEVSHHVYSA